MSETASRPPDTLERIVERRRATVAALEARAPLHVRRAVRDPDAPALDDVEITTA